MKPTAIVTLSAALVLSSSAALAQVPVRANAPAPVNAPAPSNAPGRVTPYAQAPAPTPAHAEAPTALEMPDPPAAMTGDVLELRRVTARTGACWSAHGERVEHTADRRCPAWYAQLARGGAAAVYAIGGVLVRPTSEERTLIAEGDGSLEDTSERLFRIVAATRTEVAVPVVLAYLRQNIAGDSVAGGVPAAFDALATITGNDVSAFVPWQDRWDRSEAGWEAALVRWVTWYASHRTASRAEWVAEGLRESRANLASPDAAVAFAAAQRLANTPAERPAVARTVQSLLARSDLPSAARAYITRYARRRHIAVRGVTVVRPPLTARR